MKIASFAFGSFRVHVGRGQRQQIDGGNMHGDLASESLRGFCIASRFNGNQNAKLAKAIGSAIVDIGRNNALRNRVRPNGGS